MTLIVALTSSAVTENADIVSALTKHALKSVIFALQTVIALTFQISIQTKSIVVKANALMTDIALQRGKRLLMFFLLLLLLCLWFLQSC